MNGASSHFPNNGACDEAEISNHCFSPVNRALWWLFSLPQSHWVVDFLRISHYSGQLRPLQVNGRQSSIEVTALGPWASFVGLQRAGSSSLKKQSMVTETESKRSLSSLPLPFTVLGHTRSSWSFFPKWERSLCPTWTSSNLHHREPVSISYGQGDVNTHWHKHTGTQTQRGDTQRWHTLSTLTHSRGKRSLAENLPPGTWDPENQSSSGFSNYAMQVILQREVTQIMKQFSHQREDFNC